MSGVVVSVPAGYTEEFPRLIGANDRNTNGQHCTTVPSWAVQASTPMRTYNRFAPLSADDNDDDCPQEPFTTVVTNSRRAKLNADNGHHHLSHSSDKVNVKSKCTNHHNVIQPQPVNSGSSQQHRVVAQRSSLAEVRLRALHHPSQLQKDFVRRLHFVLTM